MHEDDVTDGYTANLHFETSFFNQFNSPEVDLLSELTPRSSDFNSTNAENSVSFQCRKTVRTVPTLLILSKIENGNLSSKRNRPIGNT